MNDDQRLEHIRTITGCHEVYAIPGFPGYYVTANGEIYSFKSPGVRSPGNRAHRMHTFMFNGSLFARISRPGCSNLQRTVSSVLTHARHGIDPTTDKLAEIQRLTQELAASRQENARLQERLTRLEGRRDRYRKTYDNLSAGNVPADEDYGLAEAGD